MTNILTRLIELTSNVTDAFTTALFIAHTDQRVLRLSEHLSLSENINPETRIPIGQGPIGQVAQSKQPYHESFTNGHLPENPLYSRNEEVKGVMAVPVVGRHIEGVLLVDTKEQYGFSTKQQKLLSGLADQIAWHLSQEHQSEAVQETPGNFHEVVSWCQSLAEAEDRSALSDRIVQVPESVFECDAVAVVWFSGEEGRVHRFRGWDQELRALDVVPGKGFAGSCAKNKKPFLMRNTNNRRVVVFSEEEDHEEFGSLLAVPVMVRDQLHGLLVCGSKTPFAFSVRDQDTWTLIAAFAGNALKCAEIQTQWEYDKNLCQVTGVPNHRFLSTYLNAVEGEIFREGRPVFVMTALLKNLHTIYSKHGVEIGDLFLRQVISIFAQAVSTPKYIFKYTESAVVLILMDIEPDEARSLRSRLRQIFQANPFTLENEPLETEISLGLAFHPADGGTLGALIGVSMARASSN